MIPALAAAGSGSAFGFSLNAFDIPCSRRGFSSVEEL
jgi:hypothetical protein